MYAEDTSVPADRSRAEIEKTLTRFGADTFGYGWHDQRAFVTFRIATKGQTVPRCYRIELPLPKKPESTEDTWKTGSRGQMLRVTAKQRNDAYEQEVKSRWRAMAAVIKAKLIAVEAGISTVEKEFLADLLLPSGERLGSWVQPQLEQAYLDGNMPRLLPGLGEATS